MCLWIVSLSHCCRARNQFWAQKHLSSSENGPQDLVQKTVFFITKTDDFSVKNWPIFICQKKGILLHKMNSLRPHFQAKNGHPNLVQKQVFFEPQNWWFFNQKIARFLMSEKGILLRKMNSLRHHSQAKNPVIWCKNNCFLTTKRGDFSIQES